MNPDARSGKQVTLGVAAAQCEVAYGASWYWNRARWKTADGYVPFRVLWAAWRRLLAVQANERLSAARSVALAHAGDEGRGLLETEIQAAYPEG